MLFWASECKWAKVIEKDLCNFGGTDSLCENGDKFELCWNNFGRDRSFFE